MSRPSAVIGKRVDITLPLSESVRMPRASWTVQTTRTTADRLQQLSHLSVCPHSVTHLDLPAATRGLSASAGPEPSRVLQDKDSSVPFNYTTAFSRPCIVVNLLDRLMAMEDLVAAAMRRNNLPGRLPTRPEALWTAPEYAHIMRLLRVDVDEIRSILSDWDAASLAEKCIILCTGWRSFAPTYRDCCHPTWWAWHPFLLHPYLTQQAGEWLRAVGVKGVCTDAPSVDTPLRHWIHAPDDAMKLAWEPVHDAVRAAHSSRTKPVPIHDLFSGGDGFIIESLQLTSDVMYMAGPSMPYVDPLSPSMPATATAILTVLPFTCRSEPDALLVYAILVTEGR